MINFSLLPESAKSGDANSVSSTFRVIQGFIGALLIFLVVQGAVLWLISQGAARVNAGLINEGLPSLRLLASLRENVARYRLRAYELMFVQESERPVVIADLSRLEQESMKQLAEIKPLLGDSADAALTSRAQRALASYVDTTTRIRSILAKDFPAAMKILDLEIPGRVRELDEAIVTLTRFCDERALERTRQNHRAFTAIRVAIILLAIASVWFAAYAARSIRAHSARICQTLSGVTRKLTDAASSVQRSSKLVSSSSRSAAQRVGAQAASLEETSGSLEEVSGMTARNANDAQEARALAKQTCAAAEAGTQNMGQLGQAMDAIKLSSAGISRIIKTIDEIAFQTNILALNAAVEAARAGEAGMGFAVVADEVRALAQRSAAAARETADKIQASIETSERGTQITGEVSKSLVEIVSRARQADKFITQIASACDEQHEGIKQLNASVQQMEQVTQNNAASTEENAGAAQDLNEQVSQLQEVVKTLLTLADDLPKTEDIPATPPSRPPQGFRQETYVLSANPARFCAAEN